MAVLSFEFCFIASASSFAFVPSFFERLRTAATTFFDASFSSLGDFVGALPPTGRVFVAVAEVGFVPAGAAIVFCGGLSGASFPKFLIF